MGFISVFLIAVSLAMDAFAVSISNGISVKGFNKLTSVKQGTYFGCFQFFMTLGGWLLGSSIKDYIEAFDHWIAFGLLMIIGVNMIRESFKGEDGGESGFKLTNKRLLLQAVATSIDALAVGIGFAMLEVDILFASFVIGIVAFIISFIGGVAGRGLGDILSKRAGILGGIILIGIGIKILAEHILL